MKLDKQLKLSQTMIQYIHLRILKPIDNSVEVGSLKNSQSLKLQNRLLRAKKAKKIMKNQLLKQVKQRTHKNEKIFIQIQSNLQIRANQYLLQMQVEKTSQLLQSKYDLKQLFANLKPFLAEGSPFMKQPFQQGWLDDVFSALSDYQILVVGAGGLGCEIVKNLALSGIRKIHLVDMDTIDLTNLNRQFLFRQKDIDRKKAEVVAQFVMRRCPGVEVIPHTCKVQQMNYDFYTKFNVIIGGLDNVEARKFLNTMVFQLNQNSEQTACFYVDGATEGFEGQCIVVEPYVTSCYNCSLLDLGKQPKANYCTIANTPRTPQHCIQYVLELQWQKFYPNTKRDNDNLEHMKWIYEKSLERAKKFKIEGVTEMLTLGLAKNIIPAIASTNALIAAFCTNQALKLITNIHPKLKNYFFYKGGTMTSSQTYLINKKENCPACEMRINRLRDIKIQISKQKTFADLLTLIHESNPLISLTPFININEKTFFNPTDTQRRDAKKQKKMRVLQEQEIFTSNPQEIVVTDVSLKSEQKVYVTIVEEKQEDKEKKPDNA